MKRFFKRILQIGRRNWFSLICFEVMYRLATSIFLMRLADFFINLSLKRQNYSYLTAENYTKFIQNPYTIGYGLILIILVAFITLVEVEAVFAYFRYGMRNQKLYAAEMLAKGIKNAFLFIGRHRFSWIIYILGALPFFCLQFLVREIYSVKFLTYTAIKIYDVIPSKTVLTLICVAIIIGSVLIAFSLPYCILENESVRTSLKRAKRLLYHQRGKNLLGILGIQLIVIVATIGIYLLLAGLMVGLVSLFLKSSYRVSAVLYYGIWLKNALGVLAGSFGIVLGINYVGLFYIRKEPTSKKGMLTMGSGKRWFSKSKRKYIAIALTGVLVLSEVGYLAYRSQHYSSISDLSVNTPAVTAHRGGAKFTPENTMAAIQYSVETKSDYAEIDVQETKDHVVVLMHDTNLKRITGINASIWTMDYQEVAQLDAGVKFSSRFLGEKIPTLEEVLEYASGKIKLNIEVKANGHNDNIVSKVVQLVETYNLQDSCVITSMNYKFLRQVKELYPDIRTGYTMTIAYGSVKHMDAADFVSVKHTYVDREFVEKAHESGKEVHVWTVNYPGDVKRMVSCGVDNIITDNPLLVYQVYVGETSKDTGFVQLMRYALK